MNGRSDIYIRLTQKAKARSALWLNPAVVAGHEYKNRIAQRFTRSLFNFRAVHVFTIPLEMGFGAAIKQDSVVWFSGQKHTSPDMPCRF